MPPPNVRVKGAGRLLGVFRSILLDRSSRNKSSNDMALPHPQSRKDKYWNEDKPNSGGVVWNLFKRTVNITEYRNAKDEVNPAKNRTFDGIFHGRLHERALGFADYKLNSSPTSCVFRRIIA